MELVFMELVGCASSGSRRRSGAPLAGDLEHLLGVRGALLVARALGHPLRRLERAFGILIFLAAQEALAEPQVATRIGGVERQKIDVELAGGGEVAFELVSAGEAVDGALVERLQPIQAEQ